MDNRDTAGGGPTAAKETTSGIVSVPYTGKIPSADTIRIENLQNLTHRKRLAADWSKTSGTDAMFVLLRNNAMAFAEMFGKCNRTYRYEYTHHVWVLSYRGLLFHVYTGKKGTSYEVDLSAGEAKKIPESEICRRAAEFLAKIMAEIPNTSDGRRYVETIKKIKTSLGERD